MRPRDEEGSATVEVAVGAPGFMLLFALVLLAARVATAGQVVETAVWDATRSASIARSGDLAGRAEQVAAASLANQDLACADTSVTVDASRVAAQPGTPSAVTVHLTCVVPLWDLPFTGVLTHTMTASATAPIDSWRSS